MKRITIFLLSLWLANVASAAASSQRILARYQSLRPAAKNLGMYRLDWADSLDVALKRAAKEKRPGVPHHHPREVWRHRLGPLLSHRHAGPWGLTD
jgi:hypothetical protein